MVGGALVIRGVEEKPGFMVPSEGMIIDIIGMCQLMEPDGISLNRLQVVFDRIRGSGPRVDWYKLKDALAGLEQRGLLVTSWFVRRGAPGGGWTRWALADWGSWWQTQSRLT